MSGSRGWTRTNDPVINSHLLYRLSYPGKDFLRARILGARFPPCNDYWLVSANLFGSNSFSDMRSSKDRSVSVSWVWVPRVRSLMV